MTDAPCKIAGLLPSAKFNKFVVVQIRGLTVDGEEEQESATERLKNGFGQKMVASAVECKKGFNIW